MTAIVMRSRTRASLEGSWKKLAINLLREDKMASQMDFFPSSPLALPQGMKYEEDVISLAEEKTLLSQIKSLSFTEFEYQGYKGKRRVVSFGWRYDFNKGKLEEAA